MTGRKDDRKFNFRNAMTVELSRRGFLKGLVGTAVVVAVPISLQAAQPVPPPPIDVLESAKPPPGITYQWVRTHIMGEPDIENVETRIQNGWTFVRPKDQPHLPKEDAALAVENGGLILMQKPTAEVKAQLRAEYVANMKRAGYSECSKCGELNRNADCGCTANEGYA